MSGSHGKSPTLHAARGRPSPGHGSSLPILRPGAPIPTVTAFPDQNRFLKDVASLAAEFAAQLDVILE
jgi:hypothetical protein